MIVVRIDVVTEISRCCGYASLLLAGIHQIHASVIKEYKQLEYIYCGIYVVFVENENPRRAEGWLYPPHARSSLNVPISTNVILIRL